MRNPLLASWLLSAAIALPLSAATADPHQAPAAPATGAVPLGTQILDAAVTSPDPEGLGQGALEGRFGPFTQRRLPSAHRYPVVPPGSPARRAGRGTPVLVARSGMEQAVEVYGRQGGHSVPLEITSVIPKFGGAEDKVFALPSGLDPGKPLYARVTRVGRAVTDLQFSTSTLARGARGRRGPRPHHHASPSAR